MEINVKCNISMHFDPRTKLDPKDIHCYKQLCKAGLKVKLPTLGEIFDQVSKISKEIHYNQSQQKFSYIHY